MPLFSAVQQQPVDATRHLNVVKVLKVPAGTWSASVTTTTPKTSTDLTLTASSPPDSHAASYSSGSPGLSRAVDSSVTQAQCLSLPLDVVWRGQLPRDWRHGGGDKGVDEDACLLTAKASAVRVHSDPPCQAPLDVVDSIPCPRRTFCGRKADNDKDDTDSGSDSESVGDAGGALFDVPRLSFADDTDSGTYGQVSEASALLSASTLLFAAKTTPVAPSTTPPLATALAGALDRARSAEDDGEACLVDVLALDEDSVGEDAFAALENNTSPALGGESGGDTERVEPVATLSLVSVSASTGVFQASDSRTSARTDGGGGAPPQVPGVTARPPSASAVQASVVRQPTRPRGRTPPHPLPTFRPVDTARTPQNAARNAPRAGDSHTHSLDSAAYDTSTQSFASALRNMVAMSTPDNARSAVGYTPDSTREGSSAHTCFEVKPLTSEAWDVICASTMPEVGAHLHTSIFSSVRESTAESSSGGGGGPPAQWRRMRTYGDKMRVTSSAVLPSSRTSAYDGTVNARRDASAWVTVGGSGHTPRGGGHARGSTTLSPLAMPPSPPPVRFLSARTSDVVDAKASLTPPSPPQGLCGPWAQHTHSAPSAQGQFPAGGVGDAQAVSPSSPATLNAHGVCSVLPRLPSPAVRHEAGDRVRSPLTLAVSPMLPDSLRATGPDVAGSVDSHPSSGFSSPAPWQHLHASSTNIFGMLPVFGGGPRQKSSVAASPTRTGGRQRFAEAGSTPSPNWHDTPPRMVGHRHSPRLFPASLPAPQVARRASLSSTSAVSDEGAVLAVYTQSLMTGAAEMERDEFSPAPWVGRGSVGGGGGGGRPRTTRRLSSPWPSMTFDGTRHKVSPTASALHGVRGGAGSRRGSRSGSVVRVGSTWRRSVDDGVAEDAGAVDGAPLVAECGGLTQPLARTGRSADVTFIGESDAVEFHNAESSLTAASLLLGTSRTD